MRAEKPESVNREVREIVLLVIVFDFFFFILCDNSVAERA